MENAYSTSVHCDGVPSEPTRLKQTTVGTVNTSTNDNESSELSADRISGDRKPTGTRGWFAAGLATPLEGLKLAMQTKGLYRNLITPILIQAIVSTGLLSLTYFAADYLLDKIHYAINQVSQWLGNSELVVPGISTETINTSATVAVWCFVVLGFLWAFVVLWRLTGGIVCGYYGGRICEAAIRQKGWAKDGLRDTTMIGEMINGILFTFLLTLIQPVLGVVPFIPFVGPIIAVLVGGVYAAFLTGYGELRDPLEQMGVSKLKAFQLCAKYSGATLGIGCSTLFSQPIPFLGGLVQAAESLGRISLARRILITESGSKTRGPKTGTGQIIEHAK
jgi:uncharacterized protein involved in cysteine biosynthesis